MSQTLKWEEVLKPLPPLVRELFWVHGALIVMTILGLELFQTVCAEELASGTLLARAVLLFIAIFWGTRLVLQFVLFEPEEYLTKWTLRAGYHGLTVVFLIITSIAVVAFCK